MDLQAFTRPSPAVRAADADRERTADILRREAGNGRLSPEELSTRLDTAFTAKTMGELQSVVADLPEGNVDPYAQLMTGVVKASVGAAKIGIAISIAMVALTVALPILLGLALTGHQVAAEVAFGSLVAGTAVFARVWSRGRRRRRPSP